MADGFEFEHIGGGKVPQIEDEFLVDSEGAQAVCINVKGRRFLVGKSSIEGVHEEVLRSLRVTVEGGRSIESNPEIRYIGVIRGGYKKRVQGLVDLRKSIERETDLYRFGRVCKDGRIAGYRQKVSSNRRAGKRGTMPSSLMNHGLSLSDAVVDEDSSSED